MSAHRPDLRTYIFGVARDLVARGVIRRKQGQTWGDLIHVEAGAIGREVLEDLLAVGSELKLTAAFSAMRFGVGYAHKGVDALHQGVDQIAGELGKAAFDWLAGPKRRT